MSHIENIESMIDCLANKAKAQLDGNIESVDTHEMGEVIDMIKDLAEAKYHCVVTKAMKEGEEEREMLEKLGMPSEDEMYYGGDRRYYRDSMGRYARRSYMPEYMRDMDRDDGRMYYSYMSNRSDTPNMNSSYRSNLDSSMRGYDGRISRAERARRGYEEAREQNKGKDEKMKELESYMNELSSDMSEMIKDMSPEERTILKSKINTLATKLS